MLHESKWKDTATKNKVIEDIIIHHNYLNAAYFKSCDLPAKEQYYPYIKSIAQRKRNYSEEVGEMNFYEVEKALYALARYKKKKDIPIIKQLLLANTWRMQDASFGLMSRYPDTSYMEVYEYYYHWHFYSQIRESRSVNRAIDFINSIAIYKNDRSAKILLAILNRRPITPCDIDPWYLKHQLVNAIWDNQCAAYAPMMKQVKSLREEYKKGEISLPYDNPPYVRDTTEAEPVRW